MKVLSVGYNLVERKSIGEKYEEFEERMSIIDFLRRIKRKEEIPKKVAVIGFDALLLQDDKMSRHIRRILSDSTSYFFKRNPIIVFIIEERLVIDREPKIRFMGKEMNLYPIFRNRLTQKDVDWFHSPFNI